MVILFLALRSPMPCRPELHQKLVQIEAVGPTEDGADAIYQKTLPDDRWSQPVCAAAECILSVFESLGCYCRMGGDEFAVRLQNMTEPQVNRALSELELCISRRNLTRFFPLPVTVGHAMGQDAPIEQMFRQADANMYRNKSQMKCHAMEL